MAAWCIVILVYGVFMPNTWKRCAALMLPVALVPYLTLALQRWLAPHVAAILAAENPDWRVYWVDPGDMRTQMHQEAFPGEDISDRPLPEESVPGLVALLESDLPSGRYAAREVAVEAVAAVA